MPNARRSADLSDRQGGRLRVAMAQIAPRLGDRERNFQLHLEQIEAAQAAGADLIVFPELSLTGYFLRDMVPDVAIRAEGPEIEALLAAAGRTAVVAGFVEESPRHRFYNAALYAEGGRLVHVHRKVYLPTYGLFDEQRYFAAGDRIRAFDTARFGRVGILVCEDFWHLSAAAIMQAEEVDMLVCVANSPARGVEGPRIRTAETYDQLARTFAQLLGAVVVVVNRVGFEDGLCFWGGSKAVGPDGRTIAEAPMLDPAMTVAEFDSAELRRQRLIAPLARDERLLLTIEELNRIKHERYEA
jgi:NAD+ synthase (glutamine-hydrolysing)